MPPSNIWYQVVVHQKARVLTLGAYFTAGKHTLLISSLQFAVLSPLLGKLKSKETGTDVIKNKRIRQITHSGACSLVHGKSLKQVDWLDVKLSLPSGKEMEMTLEDLTLD